MKNKTVYIVIIMLIAIIINFIYYNNKTEKVLLSGKVFGFNIQNNEKEKSFEENELIPTSLKKIGTMTFVKADSGKFAALGHSVKEIGSRNQITGKCYDIFLDDIEKGKNGKAGKILAELNQNQIIGELTNNNSYGIFGITSEKDSLTEINTASRYEIKKQDAEILIDIDGKGLKRYEIKITKIDYLHNDQNIEFYITSQELIKKTGGIIQGMSGAPIIQKEKLVGAVNYVNLSNPLKGYGIFVDKLL